MWGPWNELGDQHLGSQARLDMAGELGNGADGQEVTWPAWPEGRAQCKGRLGHADVTAFNNCTHQLLVREMWIFMPNSFATSRIFSMRSRPALLIVWVEPFQI